MVKVCFISWCDIFPVAAGHHKAMYEICKYVHGHGGARVKAIVFSREPLRQPEKYLEIADEVVVVPIPRRWCFWDVLNKITIRIGLDMMCNFWWALAMRKRVMSECADCDRIVLNYINWFGCLEKSVRLNKTILITHDIFFYRRASFKGASNLLLRILIKVNRAYELYLLRQFYRVGVFGAYEVDLLKNGGVRPDKILQLGLPIAATGELVKNRNVEYDFITIGSNIYQNVEGVRTFFSRVVPLLDGRVVTIAVVGGISNSDIWNSNLVPRTVRVVKLGYVDDIATACRKALIGIGTVPYGSGIKVKNVEMIMNGLPIVVTNSGEEGIPVLPEGCINIDRTADRGAKDKLLGWLNNRELAMEVGYRQGVFLRQRFDPNTCLSGLWQFALFEKKKSCGEGL